VKGHEWAVRVEVAHRLGEERAFRMVDEIMDSLKSYSAVGSFSATALGVQLSLEASSPETAVVKALRTFRNALRKAGVEQEQQIVDIEVEVAEHMEARLRDPDPELVGISELAALLSVTQQRASQLAARRDFPAPYQRLASGPVWFKHSLSRFLEEWEQKRRGRRGAQVPATRNSHTTTLRRAARGS
jgi:hypothetical protein